MKDWTLHHGDCRDKIKELADASIDAIVTDPPYELGFMGKAWDASGIAYDVDLWREALRVLRPGGHLLAFSGSRTYHRMTAAIEDAGFEIRDQIMWVYGSGFPKSLDVSKAIDKAAGAEREIVGSRRGDDIRGGSLVKGQVKQTIINITAPATDAARQWQGWGTALKPAHEPICVARKPLIGTVAENVLAHGTGALNIDASRIATIEDRRRNAIGGDNGLSQTATFKIRERRAEDQPETSGRWPANLIHDGSDEVLAGFPVTGPSKATSGVLRKGRSGGIMGAVGALRDGRPEGHDDAGGSAARFFYCAKASKADRAGSKHPTVKPIALMRYLVRLVTPPGGTVLDPFAGSGTTLEAAVREGFQVIGIEQSAEYVTDIKCRLGRLNPAPPFEITQDDLLSLLERERGK